MGERFADYLSVRTVSRTPEEVVVEQPDEPELGNHVGVRHASALHAACHEASRQLVGAALGEEELLAGAELVVSDIEYKRVAMGPLRFVASRAGDGWAELERAHAAEAVGVAVSGFDESGKEVASFTAEWRVRASGASPESG